MKRILSLDYGEARVGVAITDALGITAQGLKTIFYNGNDKNLLKEIDNILLEYEIETIVIGMPYSMNGQTSQRTEKTKQFVNKLKCKYNKIKIETIDERLTTVQAHKTMNDLNINSKNKKNIVDTISAVYILENYINKNN